MKKNLLILSSEQFGYSTTLLKFCTHLSNEFNITYVGWDYELPKKKLAEVQVHYVSRASNIVARNFQLLETFHKEIQNGYDLVFTTYVRGISLIKLLNSSTTFCIYIDTMAVMPGKLKRSTYDRLLQTELKLFKNVIVITKEIGEKLNLENFQILPIGGESFSSVLDPIEKLHLIYVGTLENRNILNLIQGFELYCNRKAEHNSAIEATLTIVGNGPKGELDEIKSYVAHNSLKKYINLAGYIPQNELMPFFDKANIGVSYIPLVPYFEYQPPTKTFEYLISGLPVLATKTFANEEIIKPTAGILINDDPESVALGIEEFDFRKKEFDRVQIQADYQEYTWKNLVNQKLKPIIKHFI